MPLHYSKFLKLSHIAIFVNQIFIIETDLEQQYKIISKGIHCLLRSSYNGWTLAKLTAKKALLNCCLVVAVAHVKVQDLARG